MKTIKMKLRGSLEQTNRKLFLVCWYRIANSGVYVLEADSKKEALENFLYTKNKAVSVIVTEITKDNLPLLKVGNENKDLIRQFKGSW